MRGTVLLLESGKSALVDVELFRASGLVVHHCRDVADAVQRLDRIAPDVIVGVLPALGAASIVPSLRGLADRATSIIVASVPEERDAARRAGADFFLAASAMPDDLLYEIQRALILRRTGRRLPWR